MKRIALTGVTGTLGGDLLAEFVRDHLDSPDDIGLFVLGRRSPRHSLGERIRALVDDCAAWCAVAGQRRRDVARFFDPNGTWTVIVLANLDPPAAQQVAEAINRQLHR
jgi:hypothetical protein